MVLLIKVSSFFTSFVLLASQSIAVMQSSEINFNSSVDFRMLTMSIIEGHDINPSYITLNITLQPLATTRLMQVSRNNINKDMTVYINGLKINTTTVREELNSGSFSIIVDKKTARNLFSSLLNTQSAQ